MNDYGINAIITADSSGFTKAIQKAEQSLSGFGNDLEKVTGKVTDGLKSWGVDLGKFYDKGSSIFKSFGVDIDQFASHFGMSGALMSGIVAVTVALQQLGQEVNQISAEIAKGTGATGDALRALENDAKDAMVKGVGLSAQEAGKAIADLNTRFGVSGKEAVSLTESFASFSRVMGGDVSGNINSVADAVKKWGLETEQVPQLLDQLTVASQASGASTSELLSELSSGQTIFSQFGMSMTDSIAFLSSLSAEGINTSTAMTGLRTALAKFSAGGEEASQGLARVSEEIRNASSQTDAMRIATETFGTRAGAEMLRVIQTESGALDDLTAKLQSAGGVLKQTDEVAWQTKDAMKALTTSLQGAFGGFGQGIDSLFADILDTITQFVDFIAPVVQPIGEIFREVFSFIGELIKTLTGFFIEFQTKYNTVWSSVANVLQSTYETIHKVLGSVLSVFQDVFGMIFSILEGNWGLAWKYAERILLNTAKVITDALSWILNVFVDMANGIVKGINKLIDGVNVVIKPISELTGGFVPLLAKLGELEKVDLSDAFGINEALDTVTAEIDELTGKTAEKLIGSLGEVEHTSTDVAETISDEWSTTFDKMTANSASYADKILAQQIKMKKLEMQDALTRAENEGKTDEEILAIRRGFEDEINKMLEQQINNEREAELAKVAEMKKTLDEESEQMEQIKALEKQINEYYDNEITSLKMGNLEKITKETEEQQQSSYTWNLKLLSLEKDRATTEEERKNIQKQILEIEKKQALATARTPEEVDKINKYYKILLDELDKVVDKTKELNNSKADEREAVVADYTWTQKLLKQDEQRLQTELNNAVEVAKAEGKSEEEIAKIKEDYLKKIKDKQLEQLEIQKTIDLARSNGAEQTAEMEKYYANEEVRIAEETAKKIADIYSAIPSPVAPEKADTGSKADEKAEEEARLKAIADMQAEWEDKLFQQKISIKEAEKAYELQAMQEQGATQEELYKRNKYYTDLILNMKLEALEKEKQARLDAVTDDEEHAEIRASIEQYYLNQANEMQKDAYKEKAKYLKKDEEETETAWSKMIKGVSTVTSYMVSGFKTAFNAISSVVSKIGNVLSTIWGGFVKALDFNPDEALEGLLEFEDKILTFFYDILPQFPSFLASAFQSVASLLDTLFETIDFDGLFGSIADGLSTVLKKLPSIIQKAVPKLLTAMKSLAKSFVKILPDLLKVGMELVRALFVELPKFISQELPNLIQGIVDFLPELFGAGCQLVIQIANMLPQLLQGIIDAFIAILQNPQQIADLVVTLIKAFVNIISIMLKNISPLIEALIPALGAILEAVFWALPDIFVNIMSAIGDALAGIAKEILNGIIWVMNKGIDGLNALDIFHLIPDIPNIPYLANGTNAARKGLAVVGEAGPELVNFKGGEQVINNRNTQRLLADSGKGGNTFNVTFNNTTDTSAYQMMRQLKQYNRELAFNGVL